MQKSNLSLEEEMILVDHGHVWSWQRFWIGIAKRIQDIIFSREFLVYLLVYLQVEKMDMNDHVVWISYLAVSALFILAESIRILLANNTKLDVRASIKKVL